MREVFLPQEREKPRHHLPEVRFAIGAKLVGNAYVPSSPARFERKSGILVVQFSHSVSQRRTCSICFVQQTSKHQRVAKASRSKSRVCDSSYLPANGVRVPTSVGPLQNRER